MLFTSVVKYGGSDDGFSLPCAVVNCILQKDGIQQARETYKRYVSKLLKKILCTSLLKVLVNCIMICDTL